MQRFMCRDCRDAVPGGIAAVATWREKKNEGGKMKEKKTKQNSGLVRPD